MKPTLSTPEAGYISAKEYAEAHGLAERTVRNYCRTGKMPGARLIGKTWSIPADAPLPDRINAHHKISPLLRALREEKAHRMPGGIYHRTQVDLTYNSNHIEGSRLTKDQTRFIFETNTIGIAHEAVRVDDIIEATNHFRCIDQIIDRAMEPLSESLLKELHRTLKAGTTLAAEPWFAVGEYKRLPNEVGGTETTPPQRTGEAVRALLREYGRLSSATLVDLLDFHYRFERIHPFQEGNGRVGRLVLFKECLRHGIVPFIITEELKLYYYRGLREWPGIPGYLTDTCLSAQDHYKSLLDYFHIRY